MLQERLVSLTDNKMHKDMQRLVAELMETKESFVIWGAGQTGKSTMEYLRQYSGGRLVPQYIVDNNPALWGSNGVISPAGFFEKEEMPDNLLVCVYVGEQVICQVREAGYKGKAVVINTSMIFDTEQEWKLYEANMSAIEQVYDFLKDKESKDTLTGFLNCIRSGDVNYLKKINGDSTEKLLDPSILQYGSNEVFVDVGAFTGDTILKFIELTKGQYKRILGIELDPTNFEILQKTVQGKTDITVWNIAAGAKKGRMHFVSDCSESCVLSDKGTEEIAVIPLDELPGTEEATFIKISANGAERQILEGATDLIKRNKPKLAVYASGSELWEIPLFLKELVPEYKISYRHYGYGRQAMICYAVEEINCL